VQVPTFQPISSLSFISRFLAHKPIGPDPDHAEEL
jgi:hypothetical protein